MNEQEKLRSESLNLLRFPLALVVLTIHVFGADAITIRGHEYSFETYPIFLEINHFIDGFLRGQSVPIYFFISGYVFFYGIRLTKEKYLHKLKNRLHTLLIPFLIWNTAAILFLLLLHLPCFSFVFPNMHKVQLDFSLSAILHSYWDKSRGIFPPQEVFENTHIYPVNTPLWFLRDLMIVVLATPGIYWVLKHTRRYVVCLLGVVWFLSIYGNWGYADQLLSAFFFFSWGAYMSIYKKDMLVEFGKYATLSVVLYWVLALLHVASVHYFPDFTTTIKRVNVLVGLLFAYNLAAWLLRRRICTPNAFLASASFFIYVVHAIIYPWVLKFFFLLLLPTSSWCVFAVYVATVLFTAGGLLLTFWLMRRFTPGLLKGVAGRK